MSFQDDTPSEGGRLQLSFETYIIESINVIRSPGCPDKLLAGCIVTVLSVFPVLCSTPLIPDGFVDLMDQKGVDFVLLGTEWS